MSALTRSSDCYWETRWDRSGSGPVVSWESGPAGTTKQLPGQHPPLRSRPLLADQHSTPLQLAFFLRNASVLSLNAGTSSYSGACEQSSKMCSSEFLMTFFSRLEYRVEVTMS